jgi:small-conductance mechanosensitive channel
LAFHINALADPSNQPFDLFGTHLIGINAANGHKLLITICFIGVILLIQWALKTIAKLFLSGRRSERVVFWVRQTISLLVAILVLIGVLSIWFDNPERLATFMGLVTAGVAFALQKPISAIAGYLVILRGKTFGVGDRITMGGVRGDVVALRFTQTTIMEMGQPPDVQNADPAMWVHARQYTGRIVTVSNSTVFDTPVYNYTREFPYLWEEMRLPISYKDDRHRVEKILLEVANRHTVQIRGISANDLEELRRRYFMSEEELEPRVYWRLTDNWIELTVRFIAPTHGIRSLKDAMSREIIAALDEAKIGIASSTYDVVGMPPIQVQLTAPTSEISSADRRAGRALQSSP